MRYCCWVTRSCPTLCDPMNQHTRLSWPSLSPVLCSNSCPLSQWCHPTTLPSVAPFILPSESFPVNWLFVSGGQSFGASASVLPMNIQCWYLLGLTGLISLLSKGHSRVLSSSTIWKHQFFSTQPFIWSNFHIHTWLLEKPYFWLYGPLSAKWRLCFLIFRLGLS